MKVFLIPSISFTHEVDTTTPSFPVNETNGPDTIRTVSPNLKFLGSSSTSLPPLRVNHYSTQAGQTRIACPTCDAASIVTCSTPITVKVAHIRATITMIEFQIATVLPDITCVAPNVSPVGAQFCSWISFASVSSELENIPLTLTSIGPQVTSI